VHFDWCFEVVRRVQPGVLVARQVVIARDGGWPRICTPVYRPRWGYSVYSSSCSMVTGFEQSRGGVRAVRLCAG
jgi:hypothetical protein